MSDRFNVERLREQFPGLSREMGGRPVAFFDGPGGTQVPQRVADAVLRCLVRTNANYGGPFATSRECVELIEESHRAFADFLGASRPEEIIFGANMTTLTFALSRALARTWKPGDEVIVTQLDHDANVTPWARAADESGCVVRQVAVRPEDCTLDLDDFSNKLSGRTRLVAIGYASNIAGTVNPVREMTAKAHAAGALVFVDAVHFAPHRLIDVSELGCDFLVCSAYKFFGPHVGVLWGREELLKSLPADKVRPAPETLPDRWMTGTQNHEGIIGAAQAVAYLSDIGAAIDSSARSRRDMLRAAFAAIAKYERGLGERLISGLQRLPDVRILGITDPRRFDERVPTVSITHSCHGATELAAALAERGIFLWPGNHYALSFTEAMGLEPEGTLRIGLVHYNTADEVDRLLETLGQLLR